MTLDSLYYFYSTIYHLYYYYSIIIVLLLCYNNCTIFIVHYPTTFYPSYVTAGNPIVALNITFRQFLYCLEKLLPAVEAQKNVHYFGQITQENLSVLEYNANISKYGKLARMTEPQMKDQFIWGLSPMN